MYVRTYAHLLFFCRCGYTCMPYATTSSFMSSSHIPCRDSTLSLPRLPVSHFTYSSYPSQQSAPIFPQPSCPQRYCSPLSRCYLVVRPLLPLTNCPFLLSFKTENGSSPPSATPGSTTSSPPMMINPQMRSARLLSLLGRDMNHCSSKARREGGSCQLGGREHLVS